MLRILSIPDIIVVFDFILIAKVFEILKKLKVSDTVAKAFLYFANERGRVISFEFRAKFLSVKQVKRIVDFHYASSSITLSFFKVKAPQSQTAGFDSNSDTTERFPILVGLI